MSPASEWAWRPAAIFVCMVLLLFAGARFAEFYVSAASEALEIAIAAGAPANPYALHLGLGVATTVLSAAVLVGMLLGHVALLWIAPSRSFPDAVAARQAGGWPASPGSASPVLA